MKSDAFKDSDLKEHKHFCNRCGSLFDCAKDDCKPYLCTNCLPLRINLYEKN
jgi:hypothetical protein